MTGNVLLDTNIVIALFEGEPAVLQNVEATTSTRLSVTVLGELYFGARNSARVEENLARLDSFSEAVCVIPNDLETARLYGQIKSALRRKGRPIPENDLWIAAVAVQHDLTLVTRDEHFDGVELLKVQRW